MLKRPLCMALIVFVIFILLFHKTWNDKPKERNGEHLTMVCQVERITGFLDSTTVVVKDVQLSHTPMCNKMILLPGNNKRIFSQIRIGQIICIQGSVYSFVQPGNPGQFNEFQFYQQQGISYKTFVDKITIINRSYHPLEEFLRQLRLQLCRGLYKCCEEKDAGILIAMILGEKSVLNDEIEKLYQESGIAHVLAISGLHISIVGLGLFLVLRRYVMPMQMAAIISGCFLLAYGILTGFSVSTTRAIIMVCCMLLARLTGKRYDAYCALALSAWIQLVIQPFALFQTGFLLSYGSVFGILFFVKEFEKFVGKENPLIQSLVSSSAIQLVLMPIILVNYYEIPLYSPIANMLLLPFMGVVLGAGIISACCSVWNVLMAKFFVGSIHYIYWFYEKVCYLLESLPYHRLILGCPSVFQIVLYYVILLLWVLFSKKKQKSKRYLLIIAIFILVISPQGMKNRVEIINLDVGQGDCLLVRSKNLTVLIDGGSSDVKQVGKYRIAPALKYKRVQKIDYMVMTHSDADHTNGLLEIIQEKDYMGFQLGKIVLPLIQKKDENYRKIESICRKRNLTVIYMKKGDCIRADDLQLRCLHPYKDYDWKSENDYSLVFEMQYKKFHALFTGDLEAEGEEKILPMIRKVEYLKAAHHGSKNSSKEEFVNKSSPCVVVYSAGKRNRYGHPSKETKERMKDVGAKEYCTAEDGAITVTSDGINMGITTYRSKVDKNGF